MSDFSPSKSHVLIVDDETEHAEVMCEALVRQGFKCDVTHNLKEAHERLNRRRYDVIVTDLMMDGRRDGLDLLAEAQQLEPPPPVILVTAHNDVPTSKEAMKQGAYDYIVKPLDLDEFRAQVNRAAERSQLRTLNEILEARVGENSSFEAIIGKSAALQEVVAKARQIAQSDLPVLLLGESGVGKEVFAKAIHEASRRRKNRVVALNCAAFNESMLEGQLFGHVKGAFTNAIKDHEGVFEHANHGTVFLDEIGDMPASMQAKLLRVLENGEVVRVGSNDARKVDVRLISATNRDLDEMMRERTFREDLFYRIKGVTLRIPPLRERREDIPLLVYAFVKQMSAKYEKPIDDVSTEARAALVGYHWPGNVRELRLAIENAVVLTRGDVIEVRDLPPEVQGSAGPAHATHTPMLDAPSMTNLAEMTKEQLEVAQIKAALAKHNGNREQAAKSLGIGERTLYRKIKEYGL